VYYFQSILCLPFYIKPLGKPSLHDPFPTSSGINLWKPSSL
jgi:hypothetical protein